MCQSATAASASNIQQSALMTKISALVAKKAQDSQSLQGQAADKLLSSIAASVKSPNVGTQFDADG